MRAVPSPSASNLPTFFRWCLGGMSAFASGPGPASGSARGADAGVGGLELFKDLVAECGLLTASQKDLIVRAPFVGSGEEEEEVQVEVVEGAEVFSTPPLTQQDPQRQHQSQGQAGDGEEDGITMCTMPFTQPSAPSPASSSPSSESSERFLLKPRKPRICTRKVRGGANKIRTPTPSPNPNPSPSTSTKPGPRPGPGPGPELDPLAKIVLMIPCDPLPTSGYDDILELARSRGIFF